METLQAGQAGCCAIGFVSVGAGPKVFSDSRPSLSPTSQVKRIPKIIESMPERKVIINIITIAQSTGLRASRLGF